MNKLFLICICILASAAVFSQINQNSNSLPNHQNIKDSISVVIAPGTNNENKINEIEVLLKTQQGVSYQGYCINHNIFILSADANVYASAEIFYNYIKATSGITTLLLKEGDKNQIIPFCEFKKPQKLANPAIEKALLDK